MTFDEFASDLAKFIKKKRRQAQLSQKELADMINISQSAVAAVERADAVRLKTVFKIFQVLQLENELVEVSKFFRSEREGFNKSLEWTFQAAVNGDVELNLQEYRAISAHVPSLELPISNRARKKINLCDKQGQDSTENDSFDSTCTSAVLTLTQGNINNGHLYLASIIDLFPSSSVGGPNKREVARNLLTIDAGLGESIVTDIAGDKKIFRSRKWVKEFFNKHRLNAGDTVTVRRVGILEYVIRPNKYSLGL